MDKKKSALITTSAVLSIVAAILGILGAIAIFCLGNMYSEDSVKETYSDNPIYNYHEEDGSYYFYYFEDDMEIRIYEDEIETIVNVGKFMFNAVGIVVLGFAVAKLSLAIRVLCVGEKAYGSLISLLVLNVLSVSVVETILLVVVLCLKDKKKPSLLSKMIKE